ncbi:MAG: hypothetical protein PHR96_04450 [Clostridia bacterium]|nr:hypothetical protein [Clostridia bacterium]
MNPRSPPYQGNKPIPKGKTPLAKRPIFTSILPLKTALPVNQIQKVLALTGNRFFDANLYQIYGKFWKL